MPMGKGTYGTKMGRPPKVNKKKEATPKSKLKKKQVDIIIVITLILGMDGNVTHKTTIEDTCPDFSPMVTALQRMKEDGVIQDFGAICLPARFEETNSI